MSTNKQTIKSRLLEVLRKLQLVKQDLNQLRTEHKQFAFKTLIPKKYATYKLLNQGSFDDKQNNFGKINQNKNIKYCSKNQISKLPKSFNSKQLLSNNQFENEQQKVMKSKNNEMKDLKTNLLIQLNQIKSMERKEQSLRRTNEKIKQYNSEQKKNYRESQSRQKTQHMVTQSSQISKSIVCEKFSQSQIFKTEISIAIPTLSQNKAKTLKCQRGHQYYEGEINLKNQPHGNGRLQICCSLVSKQMGGHNLKDAQFYQGQFKNGKFDGFGTLSYRGGVKYVGEFREGRRQGKGSLYYNGKAEIAKWDNDSFVSIM